MHLITHLTMHSTTHSIMHPTMHSNTHLTTHSTMHSVTHPTTHSTTHSTTDPSQIAARSVSFVLSSFTFFFRVSLFYTCCFFCVILLRDNTRGMPRITWIMRRQRNGRLTPLGCSILRNNSYSVAANHRSHPRSHHSVRHLQLQWLLSRSSKAPTPNPIDEVIKTQQRMKEVPRNPLENQWERDSKETVGKPWNLSERETEKSLEDVQKRSLENLGERDSKEKTACLSGPQISLPRSSSRY